MFDGFEAANLYQQLCPLASDVDKNLVSIPTAEYPSALDYALY
jgi:hypothetical protein